MLELLAAALAVVPEILEVTVNLIVVASVMIKLLQTLGIMNPEEKAEDLGDKALQAEEEGITPEDYDSYTEYLRAVEEFKTDPEKSAQISQEDKLKKGLEISTATLLEKFGEVAVDMSMLIAKSPEYFEKRMPLIVEKMKDAPDQLNTVIEYMNGNRHDVKTDNEAFETLYEVEKEVNPDATMRGLEKQLDELERKGRN